MADVSSQLRGLGLDKQGIIEAERIYHNSSA